MTTTAAPPPTHVELLGLVRDVQAAVVSPDAMQVVGALQRLRSELELHVAAERRDHGTLPNGVVQALLRGQRRLLSRVANLEAEVCQDSARPCLLRVAELAALLRRQADMERRTSLVWSEVLRYWPE